MEILKSNKCTIHLKLKELTLGDSKIKINSVDKTKHEVIMANSEIVVEPHSMSIY